MVVWVEHGHNCPRFLEPLVEALEVACRVVACGVVACGFRPWGAVGTGAHPRTWQTCLHRPLHPSLLRPCFPSVWAPARRVSFEETAPRENSSLRGFGRLGGLPPQHDRLCHARSCHARSCHAPPWCHDVGRVEGADTCGVRAGEALGGADTCGVKAEEALVGGADTCGVRAGGRFGGLPVGGRFGGRLVEPLPQGVQQFRAPVEEDAVAGEEGRSSPSSSPWVAFCS